MALVLGALVLTWAGIFAFVVVTRAIYDVRTRVVDAAHRTARRRIARAARAGNEVEVDRILGRLRVATLLRAAADTSTRPPVARVFSRHLLRRAEPQIRALLEPRPHERARWQRVAALRVAALGGLPDAATLLQDAIRSSDEEVTWAGIRILGELATPQAQGMLVETLRDGTFARSRVAAQLDGRAPLSVDTLRPLLEDAEPIVRYWGAKLLAHASDAPVARDALVAAAADDSANVRAGAAESLGRNRSERATQTLVSLLVDPSPLVRIHAARSIGRRGTIAAAGQVASLLRDRDWWVRTAAKRALESLGAAAVPAVTPLLQADDEFARNGAAEILQNLGLVRVLVDRVAASANGDGQAAAAELAPILAAGGARFASLALEQRVLTSQTHLPPVRRRGPLRRPALAATLLLTTLAAVVSWPFLDAASDRARNTVGSSIAGWLPWAVVACLVYLVLVYALYAALLVFAGIEGALRSRQHASEDFETLERSRFTIPVSVVAPVYNEQSVVVSSTKSLLQQSYPEHEVIVVDDGSTDETFETLREVFDLEARDVFFRRLFETRSLAGVYRSRSDPRLIVVRKLNGGKADALNCGINFARYRYILGVDGDTVYRRDALLNGMRLVMRDPARVVAVTSHVAISVQPEGQQDIPIGRRSVDRSLLSNFQHLDYLRSFMNNRLAWSRLGFMLSTVGAFNIWRRDVLEEVGGFSPNFTCEDIEMTFRVHELSAREGRGWQILSLADTVATTEGPATIRPLIKQRARWQRVIMETVWHYRSMFGNPRYGIVGLLGVPFYFVTEVIAPIFEVLAVLVIAFALWLGLLDVTQFLLALAIMCAATGILSNMAILIDDRTGRSHRISSLVRLMLVAPLDLFLYRPLLVWARVRGTWDFMRGRRDWDKFERNARPSARVST